MNRKIGAKLRLSAYLVLQVSKTENAFGLQGHRARRNSEKYGLYTATYRRFGHWQQKAQPVKPLVECSLRNTKSESEGTLRCATSKQRANTANECQ